MYYNGGMRIYTGKRDPKNGAMVFVDGTALEVGPSLSVRSHSPDGFEWGYGGSGPSQLALAILMDRYPKSVSARYYQEFKAKFIATAAYEGFVITSVEIDLWLGEEMRKTGGSDNAV